MSAWSHTFRGRDAYAAFNAACDYLAARGFAWGPIEKGVSYIAIMHGETKPVAFTQLSPEDMNDIHGRLESNDFRNGPVTISIRPDVPGEVFEAICRQETEVVDG